MVQIFYLKAENMPTRVIKDMPSSVAVLEDLLTVNVAILTISTETLQHV